MKMPPIDVDVVGSDVVITVKCASYFDANEYVSKMIQQILDTGKVTFNVRGNVNIVDTNNG